MNQYLIKIEKLIEELDEVSSRALQEITYLKTFILVPRLRNKISKA
jgi:hypothetical protein